MKPLLELIRVSLKESEQGLVLRALRQDPVVWKSLQEASLIGVIAEHQRNTRSLWTPGSLALAMLRPIYNVADDSTLDQLSREVSLKREGVALLGRVERGYRPETLREASLIALELWRRYQESPWEQVFSNAQFELDPERWNTPLVCLWAYLEDARPLLEFLAILPEPLCYPLTLHVLLSQPLTDQEQWDYLLPLVSGQPLTRQVQWPWFILQKGREELARTTASHVLVHAKETLEALCEGENSAFPGWNDLKDRAFWLHAMALLFHLVGMPTRSFEHYEKLQALLDYWKTGAALQQMAVAAVGVSSSQAHEPERAGEIQGRLSVWGLEDALAFLAPTRLSWLEKSEENPPVWFEILQLASENKALVPERRAILEERLRAWLEDQDATHLQKIMLWLGKINPSPLLRALQTLGLAEIGIMVGQRFLEFAVPTEEVLLQMCDLCDQAGFYHQAVVYGLQGALQFPTSLPLRRKLAKAYEHLGAWAQALEEWRFIVSNSDSASDCDDQLSMIHCAIMAGSYQEAMTICQQVLDKFPENGMAHAYLGVVLMLNGEQEEAVRVLTQATLLSPHEPYPWVKLAEFYQSQGENLKAIETLRSAAIILPSSPEIHFALGKALIERGGISEALTYLRRAYATAPNIYEINVVLVETLMTLGFYEEGQSILNRALSHWPNDPRLTFINACLQYYLGADPRQVRGVMVPLLNHRDVKPEWIWFYLKTFWNQDEDLLSLERRATSEELEQARHWLQHFLAQQPEHREAQLLMGCVYLALNMPEVAYEIFKTLENSSTLFEPHKRAILQGGLARCALMQGQPEVALAALEEAINLSPEWPRLYTLRTEALSHLGLTAAARETARDLLNRFSDHWDTIEWVISYAEREQWIEGLVRGLEQATILAPQSTLHWLRLADALEQSGQAEQSIRILVNLASQPNLDSEVVPPLSRRLYAYGDYSLAAHTLSRLGHGEVVDIEPKLQVALLYHLAGERETAYSVLAQCLAHNPEWIPVQLVHAHWLIQDSRLSEALAVFEKVFRDEPHVESLDAFIQDDWTKELLHRCGVENSWAATHFSYAQLAFGLGDVEGAYHHSVQAVNLEPQKVAYRAWAVLLAQATLHFTEAEALAEAVLNSLPQDQEERQEWLALLAVLCGEVRLDNGDLDEAQYWLEKSLTWNPNHPRAVALKVRHLAALGQWREAHTVFGQLEPVFQNALTNPLDMAVMGLEWGWWGEAALAVLDWDKGINALKANAEQYSRIPLAHWRFAKGCLAAKMATRWADILEISHYRPDETLGSLQHFEQALNNLGTLTRVEAIKELQILGQCVFAPSYSSIRELVGFPLNTERAIVLLTALVEMKNMPGAEKVVERLANDPWVGFYAATFLGTWAPEKGISWALKALEVLTDFPPLMVALARSARTASNPEVALEALDHALNLWPEEWRWLEEAAHLAWKIEDPRRAIVYLERLVKERPFDVKARVTLAQMYIEVHQEAVALGHLEKALQVSSEDLNVIIPYLQVMLALGEAKRANELAQKYLEKYPDHRPLLRLGIKAALAAENWAPADALSQALVELEESDPEAVLLRAAYLERRVGKSEALDYLEQTIRKKGESSILLAEKARLVSELEGLPQALPIIQRVLDQEPNHLMMLEMAAQAYWEIGDTDQAEHYALRGLQNDPEQSNLHALMGQICAQKGQLDKALYHLGEAIRLNPAHLDTYLNMARVYLQRREAHKAFEVFQQALRLAPQDYRVYHEYGLALRDYKDYAAAEAMLRRAAQLAPDNAIIKRQLGALVALNLVHHVQEA
ncbi:tetratricopeptide repeat protein [Thermanaerothrix sp.]|uniref:tetratricopeptide repeat protein n=1 Tax=Thermanaerothrix sp. TaxID=2972675 RepID=UPI002ADDB6AC|nr:tetratricopeptide repeat protein [Thermanaerothrix sp.]